MFTDKNGNEFQVLQMLYDALMLERTALFEEMETFEGKSIIDLLGGVIQRQNKQIDHLMRAVGNLESRLMALQEAAGIDEVAYSAVDLFHENPDDE